MTQEKSHRLSDPTKRCFLTKATASAAAIALARPITASAEYNEYDVVVIGGGTAGMPTAIFAAERGARVVVIEAASQLGGTLFLSGARMSAAGTKLQTKMGIQDTPDLHFEDVMRASKNKADPELLRLAVESAGPMFDWLWENGLPIVEGTPANQGMTHAGQNRARYVWAPNGGMDVLEVLDRAIAPHIESGQITVLTNTEVTALHQSLDGRISDVVAKDENGKEVVVQGRAVVLTSGGYTANSDLFEELEGAADYADNTYPYSQGIGIKLGLSVDGFVRGGEHHLASFGAVMLSDSIPSPILCALNNNPKNRQPWEIWVNAHGERFLREDTDDIHEKEMALIDQPDERFWAVFDDQIFRSSPPVVSRWTREDIASAFNEEEMFTRADTLDELASMIGIDPSSLSRTVERYNAGQRQGRDMLGRKHLPMAIEKGPFYSIRSQSSQLISFAGLAVDKELRVLRTDQKPVPNLYAAGEVLGVGQLMGQYYFGGMAVTPALALGRALGKEIIDFTA